MANYIITQTKSTIGIREEVKQHMKSLGLKKIGSKSIIQKLPASDGLVAKVSHLIKFEVVES
jgi:large subunit ribosomal protein L30